MKCVSVCPDSFVIFSSRACDCLINCGVVVGYTAPSLHTETYLTSFARLFVSLLVAFSYPLQCHPARRCIITLVSSVQESYFAVNKSDDKQALAGTSPSSSTGSSGGEEGGAAHSEVLVFNIITVSMGWRLLEIDTASVAIHALSSLR